NDTKYTSGLTLRTRLGYETGKLFSTKGYIEMSDTRIVGGVDNFAPAKSGYNKIVDPEITRLNQAYLKTSPVEGLTGTVGRQRIILDNARFVGNVGWRQTEQVYDAARIEYSNSGFKADISYLWDVHGIASGLDREAQDVLANLSYVTPVGKVTGYYYLNKNTEQLELATSGLRFAGKTKAGDIGLNYQAEYAMQEDSINDKEADYMHAVFGASYKGFGLTAGYEVLGSDEGSYGFSTPLATKHAFNGWADIFLGTPADGLADTYVKLSGAVAGVKMAAIYHSYESVDSSTEGESSYDLGSEINVVVVKPFAKKYKVGVKFADYSAAENTNMVDTTKYWAFAEMKF
ncbi:MAG: alginate export family protein, partial [Cellvibrionales bacterium]|nr:alginate export family protein [Cellvibrionales bacterium]